jgi:hypothetical protein
MRAYATHVIAYRRQAAAEPLLDRAREFVDAQRSRIGTLLALSLTPSTVVASIRIIN